MSDNSLPQVAIAEFTASTQLTDGIIVMKLSGNADHVVLQELDGLVPKLHAEARRIKVPEVTVDMRELEFMNSSCFCTFVNWVGWIRRMEPEEQYRLRFVAAPERHWQRPSLQALACFATNIVVVDNLDLS